MKQRTHAPTLPRLDRSTPAPKEGWWDFITTTPRNPFREIASLYHALADADAKVKQVCVTSSHEVYVELEKGGVIVPFEIGVFLKNEDGKPRLDYVRSVIMLVKRRNKVLGRTLSGIWMHILQEDEKLQEIASG